MVDEGSVTVPQQATSNDEEPLVFELDDPALGEPSTSSSGSSPHEGRRPTLIEKMERLTDMVSGMEARIAMVGRLTNVVANMSNRSIVGGLVGLAYTISQDDVDHFIALLPASPGETLRLG